MGIYRKGRILKDLKKLPTTLHISDRKRILKMNWTLPFICGIRTLTIQTDIFSKLLLGSYFIIIYIIISYF